MLSPAGSYEEARARFRWRIPPKINIGVDVCDRQAATRGEATALIFEDESGAITRYRFIDIKRLTDRLANVLLAHGLQRGDRVGILLSQSPEVAIAHVAAYKAGLIAVPLFVLFGEEALEYRLSDSGARALVTDRANYPKVQGLRERLPGLDLALIVGGEMGAGTIDFWRAVEAASDSFTPVDTDAEEPALIIYTSGTTGPPKGALQAHRTILGHLPGVEFPHEFFPQPGDLFWTPADWAWIGGLLDALLPSWHHGVPVLAHRFRKFDPEAAFALMIRHRVRNTFLPPTALKMLRQVASPPPGLDLRSVASGGETLGAELLDWGRKTLGVTVNEFYGQTECNLMVANCAKIMEVRPGSMGRAIPGHDVAVVDADGQVCQPGQVGEIAFRRPDPVLFLEYWRKPEATKTKFIGDWMLTGDTGRMDPEGYLWFQGRSDDVITSAGYRIGPAEIEDCLLKHPAVAIAAAIGVPDPVRTEIVKAFIVPKPDVTVTPELASEIQAYVRTRLAAHEYPREIEFRDSLPMTATGKIMRRELRAAEAAKGLPASSS